MINPVICRLFVSNTGFLNFNFKNARILHNSKYKTERPLNRKMRPPFPVSRDPTETELGNVSPAEFLLSLSEVQRGLFHSKDIHLVNS